MKIKELFSDMKKWCKDWMAKDSSGFGLTTARNSNAVRWCLLGAVEKCYPQRDWLKILRKICSYIEADIGYDKKPTKAMCFKLISRWNDSTRRTYKDVKKLVEDLDI